MVTLTILKPLAAAGFVALSLSAGAGIAAAAPDTSVLVNTTCSYDQVVAAINSEVPGEASGFNSSPQLQGLLRDYLSAPKPDRESMVQQGLSHPFLADDIGAMLTVANSCNKY